MAMLSYVLGDKNNIANDRILYTIDRSFAYYEQTTIGQLFLSASIHTFFCD